MFKKYFLSILSIFVFSFVFANHSYAFLINVTGSTNTCAASQNVSAQAVSDFKQHGSEIVFCASSVSGGIVSIKDNDNGTIYGTLNLSPNTIATTSYPGDKDWSSVGGHIISVQAFDGTNYSSSASYNMNISYAPITLTIHNNTKGVDVPAGGSVDLGDNVSFLCTNSLNMYLDNQSGTNPPVSTYIGTNYNVGYTPTSLSGGVHTVGCTNIGTPTNDVSKSFTVISPDMSGTLSAPDCTIAVGASTCSTTFSWSIQNKEGNTTAITASGVSDMLVSSSITPSSESGTRSATIYYGTRTYFLYNNAKSVAQVDVSGVCASGSSWDGSKCAAATPECPVGTPSGANAYPDCSCPSGTYQILPANVCAPCNAPNIYNATTHTCNAPGPIPYTHFLSFNVSGGYVPKGSKINLNWSIQKPDASCNITAKSLKDGSEIMNIINGIGGINPFSLIRDLIMGDYGKTLSVGDFTKIIGSGFTVNQSTRFTASCIAPEGSYIPGYHQLVRDVYVTGEERN